MLQENGRVVRESILMGPNGAVKVRSIWEGAKLITFELYGAGDRFTHGGNQDESCIRSEKYIIQEARIIRQHEFAHW